MEILLDPYKQTNLVPTTGRLLIAEPYLNEPNFARSVIYLTEHGEEGTVGFALNRPTDLTLGDLLPELYTPLLSVFRGGPVQIDTLHMLHRTPSSYGGSEVGEGTYWGGSYEALQDAIRNNDYQPIDMRLFVGYSGWKPGQLEEEIAKGSWLVAEASQELLFETDANNLWKRAIEMLGREFTYLSYLPLNPQLN